MTVEIPANSMATVFVPAVSDAAVIQNGKMLSVTGNITVAGMEDG